MKVHKGYYDRTAECVDPRWTKTFDMWLNAAYQCSLEYGVLVEVVIEADGKDVKRHFTINPELITRIVFRVGEHRFDSLNELKSALKNKAFL